MKLLLIATIIGNYALAAGAETTPGPVDKAEETKTKQEMVKSMTQDKGYGVRDAEGSAKAAKTKDMPKVLPDMAAKQKAMQSVTSSAGKGYGQSAAEGAAKAAADTSPRKERPKMSDYEKQLQKASE